MFLNVTNFTFLFPRLFITSKYFYHISPSQLLVRQSSHIKENNQRHTIISHQTQTEATPSHHVMFTEPVQTVLLVGKRARGLFPNNYSYSCHYPTDLPEFSELL